MNILCNNVKKSALAQKPSSMEQPAESKGGLRSRTWHKVGSNLQYDLQLTTVIISHGSKCRRIHSKMSFTLQISFLRNTNALKKIPHAKDSNYLKLSLYFFQNRQKLIFLSIIFFQNMHDVSGTMRLMLGTGETQILPLWHLHLNS